LKPKKTEPKTGILMDVAKAVGSATGTVASLIGTSLGGTTAEPGKASGKLLKKNKPRLPRRQKKAAAVKKAASTTAKKAKGKSGTPNAK
jgi:hypothetical protein